jgi:hypothetical protein
MFSSPTIAPKRQTIADIYCVFFPVAFFRFGNFCLKFCRVFALRRRKCVKNDGIRLPDDFIKPRILRRIRLILRVLNAFKTGILNVWLFSTFYFARTLRQSIFTRFCSLKI